MSRPTPAQDLKSLPWTDEMPDKIGLWWYSNDEGEYGFVEHLSEWDLEDLAEDGRFSLCTLDISRMTRERWEKDGWKCCPVVLSA